MHRLPSALLLLGAVLLLAACSAQAAGPATPRPSVVPGAPGALTISSVNLEFSTDRLRGPAGKPFQIVYENQEGAPHNVSIYRTAEAKEPILVEAPFSGPKTVTYDVPALEAGSYFFRCDVHPDMQGTLDIG